VELVWELIAKIQVWSGA